MGMQNGCFAMKRLPWKFVTTLSLSAIGIAALAMAAHVSLARQSSPKAAKTQPGMEPVPALTPFVEEHAHFDFAETDPDRAIRSAFSALGRENAAMILFQISPDTFDHPGRYDSEILLSEVKKHPGKLAITGRRRIPERHDHAVRGHWGCGPGSPEEIQGARGRTFAGRRDRIRRNDG